MKKWIILTTTLCQGTIPAWFGDDDKPVLFDTEEAAQTEMLDEYRGLLEHQIDEFKLGDRNFDDIDTELQDWVEACEVKEDGSIWIETGELYNPKTYVR